MERWSFDCQVCGRSIGDPWYVDEYWWVCPWETGWLRLEPEPDREGLVYHKHTIRGRGWKRLGYTLCARCATKAKKPKCPTCGAPLIRVHADQHPGGEWGIRGVRPRSYLHGTGRYVDKSIPKREPAPMR